MSVDYKTNHHITKFHNKSRNSTHVLLATMFMLQRLASVIRVNVASICWETNTNTWQLNVIISHISSSSYTFQQSICDMCLVYFPQCRERHSGLLWELKWTGNKKHTLNYFIASFVNLNLFVKNIFQKSNST